MKKCIIIVLIIALNLNMLPCSAINTSIFDDLPTTAKEYRAVVSLKNLGVIDGKSERIFDPDSMLTREEFAKIISLAAKIEDITVEAKIEDFDTSEYQNRFSDVSQNDWYSKYIEIANESGLLIGISENEFGVGSNITKQDAMTVLYRLLTGKIKLQDDLQVKLPADADLAEYAKEAVGSLAAIGIVNYDGQNLFHPCEYIKRASLCKAIYDTLTYAYSMKTYGVSGKSIWLTYPDNEVRDDKLTKYKPEIFDVETKEKTIIAVEDFEDGKYNFGGGISKGSITEDEAYSGKKALMLSVPESGTQVVAGRFEYKVTPSEIGSFFVATCMVKCQDLAKATGFCVDIYDANNKYLKGIYESNSQAKGTTDWVQVKQMFQVPEGTAYFVIQIYFDAANKGTAYYDDLTLQKVAMNPMETIMLSPAYKGFIYGDSDINYDITIDEQAGVYDVSAMKLNIKLVDEKDNVFIEKNIDFCTLKQNVTLSTEGIAEGDYYLETRVIDKESGEELQLDYNVIRKRAKDYRPAFYVDEYGRTIKNGKPFFMRAFYDLWGDEGTETIHELAFDYLKGSDINFNAINPYDYYWRFNEPLYYFKPFSELEDRGISISAAFHGFFLTNEGRLWEAENSRNVYSNMVYQMKQYPSIFGYYIFDEQDLNTMGDELKWRYNVVSDADPDKPTLAAHYKTDYRYGTLTKVTDILMEDIYPVYGLETDDIAAKGRALRAFRDQFPNRPIYSVIQAFKGGMSASQGQREPNEEELRNMVWQAICEGVQGISFWASFVSFTRPNLKPSLSWQEYMGIQNKLMGEVKQLNDVLTSADPKPYYELKGSKDCFNITSKHHDKKSYVFMVNNTNDVQSGVLKLDDDVKSITSLYTGETYNVGKDGYFKIEFDPLQVEIFEYEQDSYQSSEADLKFLKFYLPDDETVVINYVDDEAVIRLPQSVETIKYSATIGRKAKIYVDGNLSEASGNIAVNGKNSINVKVVSENEKFATEKTYKVIFEEGTE